jgi:hypothetical protein
MLSFILLDLTLNEIVADIPRDGASIVVYLLIAIFVGLIWAGSRGDARANDAGGAPHER